MQGSIEKLLCVRTINQILIQSGYELSTINHVLDLNHKNKQTIAKNCAKFALNLARKRIGQIIVITKNRIPDVLFYMFDENTGTFKKFTYFTREITLP
jgi:hypothetical protein